MLGAAAGGCEFDFHGRYFVFVYILLHQELAASGMFCALLRLSGP